MNKPLLEIKDLSIAYSQDHLAVDHISLSVSEGEIVTIVGQSGSGKSTLIHAILGLMDPSASILSGSIVYREHHLEQMTSKLRRQLSGTEITMIFQNSDSHFDPIKRVKYQFDEFLRAHGKYSKKEMLDIQVESLEKMGFKDPMRVLHNYPFELSGGMQQRVSLAMAIALKPKLILADEPTSALDVNLQKQIIDYMIQLSQETHTAILLVTHNMGVAAYMSDKIVVMNQGKVIECGTREQMIEHPSQEYTKELLSAIPQLDEEQFGKY